MSVELLSIDLPPAQELAAIPREQRNGMLLEGLQSGKFDYLDFGTHKGGGMRLGQQLGGKCGLGIEINEAKCQALLKNGYYVISEDIFRLPAFFSVVDFAVLSHVLEHLPNSQTIFLVLRKLLDACRKYVLIEQPDFTAESYLYSLGLRLAHFGMKSHTCHLRTRELIEMLWSLNAGRFIVGGKKPINDSSSRWVHRADQISSAGAPWDAEKHLPKPQIKFDRALFRDIVVVIGRDQEFDTDSILRAVSADLIYMRSYEVIHN